MRKYRPRHLAAAGCALAGILLGLALLSSLYPSASLHTVLTYTPRSPLAAAGVLLLFYGLKSITIFFPLLELAAGHLFPAPAALAVNFIGMWIVLTVPYWIGRALGLRQVSKLTRKYPRFHAIVAKQQGHSFFLCFFLRAVSCLPGDIVTLYLGATRTPFWHNLLGGTLGILPGMVLATLMGSSIQDPSSPPFLLSTGSATEKTGTIRKRKSAAATQVFCSRRSRPCAVQRVFAHSRSAGKRGSWTARPFFRLEELLHEIPERICNRSGRMRR